MDFSEFYKELEAEFLGAGAKLMGLQILQLELRLGKNPSRSFRSMKSADILCNLWILRTDMLHTFRDSLTESFNNESFLKLFNFNLRRFRRTRTYQSSEVLTQKNTLAEYMILSGADNRPPMLDKDLYDSWKSQMELYMQNKEHERMILESVEHGPLIWPTIEENDVIRTKKYVELSIAEKIQVDCDMKATNIILQGLPAVGN
ncbi:hypothetical protein Tco_0760553 [Tanacetum coccineum]